MDVLQNEAVHNQTKILRNISLFAYPWSINQHCFAVVRKFTCQEASSPLILLSYASPTYMALSHPDYILI
jgi:hypothetical protein